MQRCLQEVAVVLQEAAAQGEEEELRVDSLLRRLSNTLKKTVGAEARLHLRTQALPEDVVRAFEVVQLKVRAVLGALREDGEPLSTWAELVEAAEGASFARRARIEAELGGCEATAAQIARVLNLPLVAVERYLQAHAKALPGGRYRVPGLQDSAPELINPPGSAQQAPDLATAEKILAYTPTLCVVLPRAAMEQARGSVRWAVRQGPLLQQIDARHHPGEVLLAAGDGGAGLPATGPLIYGLDSIDRMDLLPALSGLYTWLADGELQAHPHRLAIFSDDVPAALVALAQAGVRPGGRYDLRHLVADPPEIHQASRG